MIYSVLDELPQLVTLELKHWLVNWLLHFAISSPIAPLAIDTEWLSSHDPLISQHIPPPGADDPDRREAKLDVPTPQSNTFLPNLRLLIISPDDPTESIFFSQYDLGLALRRILHARPNLSLHYDGFFMAGGTANFEKGQALLSESMDLGHIRFGGRVDALYSGVQNDIVV
ncbi:hypothetical protein DL93DRAFT_2169037 [Clavulina sp. PMI_390]|nr:hypothetical protein DL93DRAFT_2169037 [Clavulina sp. PMI_390]